MDRWPEALTAFGGFAAVGAVIDLAMYKSEKVKLKAKLEDWWLRFTDVKWSNFGRREAELRFRSSTDGQDQTCGQSKDGNSRWRLQF